MVVEDSVAATNHRPAVAGRIPSETEARRDIVRIHWNAFEHVQRWLSRRVQSRSRLEHRCPLDVVAHSVIESQPTCSLPAILDEQTECRVIERPIGISDALDKYLWEAQPVCLHSRESGNRNGSHRTGQPQRGSTQ